MEHLKLKFFFCKLAKLVEQRRPHATIAIPLINNNGDETLVGKFFINLQVKKGDPTIYSIDRRSEASIV